jgi:hypothetical protein
VRKMRLRRCVILFLALIVIGAGSDASAAASESARAHVSRVCDTYTVVSTEKFGAQRHRFTIQIKDIKAARLTCNASRRLIRRADAAFHHRSHAPGQYISVAPWQCMMTRPVFGVPGGLSEWLNSCRRSGDQRLSWTEEEVSQRLVA